MYQLFSNRRLLLLTVILIISNLIITGVSVFIIYNKSISSLKSSLIDIVERQKSLVTVLHEQGKSKAEIIYLIKTLRERHYGLGKAGEFAIAFQKGDSLIYLLSKNNLSNLRIDHSSKRGMPMRMALQGKTGSIVALDYYGVNVLAAYTYVDALQWGIVAKIPTTEVNRPYYDAIWITFIINILLIMFCVYLFIKISNPIIKSIIESEHTYRMLFQSINDAVFVSEVTNDGKSGKFIQVNDIACQRLGYTHEEFLSLTPFDINSKKLKPSVPLLAQDILNKKHAIIETEHLTKEGRIIPVEISTNVTNLKNKTVFYSIARDITERKQAEDNLRKSEELFRKLFENMLNGFAYCKILIKQDQPLDYIYLNVNKSFETLTGLKNVVGKKASEAIPGIQETDKELFEIYARVATMGNPETFEIYLEALKMWFLISVYSPEKEYFVAVFDVITERKEAEFYLKEKNEEIEAQNEEYKQINEELFSAKEHAEESDRLKTAFLQNMSHEIRTPMNAIMGFSDLLADQYNNKPKLEHYSNIIKQRCGDLLDIINEILDISKIESGQLPIHFEECKLNSLLAELSLFFKENQLKLGKQNIKFNVHAHCDPSNSVIITDVLKLKQIFINLIGNAFKFTEKGEINAGCNFVDNKLIFYVSDTGIGIPADKKDKIFDRFTQLDHGTNRLYGGTGLGLSIVKGLINLLGGEIWLESEQNKGTTFYFTLSYRISDSVFHEPMAIEHHSKYNFKNKSILIVEDDVYNAEFLKEILIDTGFNIIHTLYGQEAVSIALSSSLDMVLMDISLPDISGYEATLQIKQHKPNLKIIAQTAYAASEDRKRATDAGCNDYISKPLKRDLLLAMINKYI